MQSNNEGWVRVDRSIRDTWIARRPEYIAIYMTIVWGVNFKPSQMVVGGQLIAVETGEMVTSIRSLSERSGTSEKHVRTFLKHAQESGIIRSKKGTAWTHLKLMDYNELTEPQKTDGHSSGTNWAQSGQHHKKERKKKEEEELYNNVGEDTRALARTTRPSMEDVVAAFVGMGSTEHEATRYWDYYTANGWKVGRNAMKDWKAAARNWVRNQTKYTQGKHNAKRTLGDREVAIDYQESIGKLYAMERPDRRRERNVLLDAGNVGALATGTESQDRRPEGGLLLPRTSGDELRPEPSAEGGTMD